MRISDILTEEVYGTKATIFHRTKTLDNVLSIAEHNFKKEYDMGSVYGAGLYATYMLEDQLNDNMKRNYGNYIIKFSVTP